MFESGKVRTELTWTGKKKKLGTLPKLPFQTAEIVNETRKRTLDSYMISQSTDEHNLLIWGDNKLVMNALLKDYEGKVNLIYIDPPFATGADFKMPIKVNGDIFIKSPSGIEIKAYRDTWGQGLASYLQMMYDRLILMKNLLAENGSIYVHLDWHAGHYVKMIADEIFGKENFVNEIIWRKTNSPKAQTNGLGTQHDIIFMYAKNFDAVCFSKVYREPDESYLKSYRYDDKDGRGVYQTVALANATSLGGFGKMKVFEWRGVTARWIYSKENLEKFWREGKIYKTKSGMYRLKSYLKDIPGQIVSDLWIDREVSPLQGGTSEHLNFPTQKPEALLKRIIKASSTEGDLVADFFCGSGTTLAEKLGRRWIGCDLSKYAIHVTKKRLLDLPGCKSFKIRNLGKYQKHKLIENGIKDYFEFILQLYGSTSVSGYAHIHGRIGSRLVHVGTPDSFVTEREVKRALEECRSANSSYLDVLGWEFEMGLYELIEDIGMDYGVNVKLKQIPIDILDMREKEFNGVKFFDLNYLDLDSKVKDRKVTIAIDRFVFANPEYIPDEMKLKDISAYIDYWAVDFDYKGNGDAFHNVRQEYRTREHKNLNTKISYEDFD